MSVHRVLPSSPETMSWWSSSESVEISSATNMWKEENFASLLISHRLHILYISAYGCTFLCAVHMGATSLNSYVPVAVFECQLFSVSVKVNMCASFKILVTLFLFIYKYIDTLLALFSVYIISTNICLYKMIYVVHVNLRGTKEMQ